MKVLFLLFLVTAKRVGEFQAISCRVAFQGHDLSLAYLPESDSSLLYGLLFGTVCR